MRSRGRFVLGEEILSPAAIWAHRRLCAMAIPPLRHPHRTRCNNTARRYPSRLHPRPAIVRTRRTSSIDYASHSPNLAGSQTLRPTGWFLADEAMKPRRSQFRRHFGRGWGVRFLDRRRHPYLTAPPKPSAQGERAAEFAARADSSSHEHAASGAGRVVNGVDDHSRGIAAPLHRVDASGRPIAPLVAS